MLPERAAKSPTLKNAEGQNVGGELALTISQSSRPGFKKRCGMELLK
jgi:hypothetical protein